MVQGKPPDTKNVTSGNAKQRTEQLGRQHKALAATLLMAEQTLATKRQKDVPAAAIEHAEDSVLKLKKALVENEQQAAWLDASRHDKGRWQVISTQDASVFAQ